MKSTLSVKDLRQVGGPRAWTANRMRQDLSWIRPFDTGEREELLAALRHAKARGRAIPEFGADAFPLPSLGATLQRIKTELVDGRGFVLFRNTPIEELSDEDAGLMYWGIGSHLGQGVAQNAQGEVLGHVVDIGRRPDRDHHARGYQSKLRLPFHVDASDLVALLCLRTARTGGESCIASSIAIHDAMVTDHPDEAAVLYGDFYFDRRGEEAPGTLPYYKGAMFTAHEGRLYARYNRTYVESAQRLPEVPRLTAGQIAAFDLLDALCADPRFRLDMQLEPGDLQIVNNYGVLHSRTEYEDHPEPARRRHLLRLWLRTGAFEDLPKSYRDRYSDMAVWQMQPRAPSFCFFEPEATTHS